MHAEGCQIAAVLTAIAGQDYLLNDLEIGGTIGPISVALFGEIVEPATAAGIPRYDRQ